LVRELPLGGFEGDSASGHVLRACGSGSLAARDDNDRLAARVGGRNARALRMQRVTVRVPASTSNLGPGFDCLGVALRLYNDVQVRRGDGAQRPTGMMREAAQAFFRRADCKTFAFSSDVSGSVPASRGLGSSVTVRLGVLAGLNELAGRPLTREQLFEICTELEGHPDNAAPATFGGFNVCRPGQRQRFAVGPALKFVLLIPSFEVRTKDARALLPSRISWADAVASCGNACAVTASFASGNYEGLRGAFADGLHQPFRKRLIPFFDAAIHAAETTGALGGFLSGSGSTIAAVALRDARGIGSAMLAAAGGAGEVVITTADNRGMQITK
jgi:homoserine kinase